MTTIDRTYLRERHGLTIPPDHLIDAQLLWDVFRTYPRAFSEAPPEPASRAWPHNAIVEPRRQEPARDVTAERLAALEARLAEPAKPAPAPQELAPSIDFDEDTGLTPAGRALLSMDASTFADETRAWHEAAHAVVAQHFGYAIRFVTIDPVEDISAGMFYWRPRSATNLDRTVETIAGGVAEFLQFGRFINGADEKDLTKDLTAAGLTADECRALISEAYPLCLRLLRQNWARVQEIAEALKIHRTLPAEWFGEENAERARKSQEAKDTFNVRRVEMPLATRSLEVRSASFDAARNTVEICWSSGAPVKRTSYEGNYWEILEMGAANVRLEFFNSGKAPFLNSHRSSDTQDVLGNIIAGSVYLRDGKGYAQVQLSTRASAAETIADIQSRVLRNVSIGYRYHRVIEEKPGTDGIPIMRVVDFEPLECSICAIPADQQAEIRTFECDVMSVK